MTELFDKEREVSELSKRLGSIEASVVGDTIDRIFHKYPELKEKDNEYKSKIYEAIKVLNKTFGFKFTKALILGEDISPEDRVVDPLSPAELLSISAELQKASDESRLNRETFIELSKSKLKIESINIADKSKIVSSYDILKNSELTSKFGKELPQISANIDAMNFEGIKTDLSGAGISFEVMRNLSSSLTFIIMEFLVAADKDTKNKLLTFFEKYDGGAKEMGSKFWNVISSNISLAVSGGRFIEVKNKLDKVYEILNKENVKKVIGKGDSNKILSNPNEYRKLMSEYISGKKTLEQVEQELLKASSDKNYKFNGLSETDISDLKVIGDNFSKSLNKEDVNRLLTGSRAVGGVLGAIEGFKQTGRQVLMEGGLGGILVNLKDTLGGGKMWDTIRSFLRTIFKWLGWESFDDFENEFMGETFNGKISSLSKKFKGHPEYNIADIVEKKLSELNYEEAGRMFMYTFGDGIGTKFALDIAKRNNESNVFLTRIISLGKHEGGLEFGRTNWDPNTASKQCNMTTFQLSQRFESPTNTVLHKFMRCFQRGLKMSGAQTDLSDIINSKDLKDVTPANFEEKVKNVQSALIKKGFPQEQQDLIAWLGYIYEERGGEETLKKLADPKVKNKDLINHVSTRIQGGISAIGQDVARMEAGSVKGVVGNGQPAKSDAKAGA